MRFACLIVCLGVLFVSLGGCGGGGGGGDSGGGGSSSYSMVGTWRLTQPTGNPFELVRMVFNSDSSASATYGSGTSATGTWSLSGSLLTLTLTGGGSASFTITWVDSNHFESYVGSVKTTWERV